MEATPGIEMENGNLRIQIDPMIEYQVMENENIALHRENRQLKAVVQQQANEIATLRKAVDDKAAEIKKEAKPVHNGRVTRRK